MSLLHLTLMNKPQASKLLEIPSSILKNILSLSYRMGKQENDCSEQEKELKKNIFYLYSSVTHQGMQDAKKI